MEDKIGSDFWKPLLIDREGAFLFAREEVETMDMESDMGEGDMVRLKIIGSTIIIHPPLRWPFRERLAF